MKKIIYLLLASFFMLNCSSEQTIFIPNDSFSFRMLNFTDDSFQKATLYIGVKDANNNFVATESIEYDYVPSNLSPTGSYTNLEDCTFNCNEGFIDGFHYYFFNSQYFVDVPFSEESNLWNPDLSSIIELSDEFTLLFQLPNGVEKEIKGFDLRKVLIENPSPVNARIEIRIEDNGINSSIIF